MKRYWDLIVSTTVVWWFWLRHESHPGFVKVETDDMYGFYCHYHEEGMALGPVPR